MTAPDTCFCCELQLAQSHVDGPRDWPAVLFEATGNYGSTIFDPRPSEPPAVLRIRICDRCLVTKRNLVEDTKNRMVRGLRRDVERFYDYVDHEAASTFEIEDHIT